MINSVDIPSYLYHPLFVSGSVFAALGPSPGPFQRCKGFFWKETRLHAMCLLISAASLTSTDQASQGVDSVDPTPWRLPWPPSQRLVRCYSATALNKPGFHARWGSGACLRSNREWGENRPGHRDHDVPTCGRGWGAREEGREEGSGTCRQTCGEIEEHTDRCAYGWFILGRTCLKRDVGIVQYCI